MPRIKKMPEWQKNLYWQVRHRKCVGRGTITPIVQHGVWNGKADI